MIDAKKQLHDIVTHEVFYLIRHASHPPIHKDIDAVWVFSGPGTFFIPLDPGEPKILAWMDRYRILYGFAIMRKVTANRLGKHFEDVTGEDIAKDGPLFIYNGTPKENDALRKELAMIETSIPPEKVKIVGEVKKGNKAEEIGNTRDQIESFPQKLIGHAIRHRIALVSHAAHLSRILRYLKKYKIFLGTISLELFPIVESKKQTMYDVEKETEKIWQYFQQGDLAWDPFPAENFENK